MNVYVNRKQLQTRRAEELKWNLIVFLLLLLVGGLEGCSKKSTLKAIHPSKTRVESTVTPVTSGTIEAEQMAILSFGGAARVKEIFVRAGDQVKKGDLIAKQDNSDLETIYREATDELKRAEELFKEAMVSKAAMDEARKRFEVARTNLDRSVIRAPFEGMITDMNLQVGEIPGAVQGVKVPVRIVDLKPRLIRAELDEIDLGRVKEGQKARVRIPALQAKNVPATVKKVIPFISTTKEQDRTAQIELALDDSNEKTPVGASADIEIVINAKDGVLAVPTRTLLGSQAGRHVFVAEEGSLKKVLVKVGDGNYDRTEVLEGLTDHDTVVFPADDVELKDGLKAKIEMQTWP